jgi:hypothetical protein
VNQRLTTLKKIAEDSATIKEFGRHLCDWLHELRRVVSREQAAATFAEEPPRLAEKFLRGELFFPLTGRDPRGGPTIPPIAEDWARSWRAEMAP